MRYDPVCKETRFDLKNIMKTAIERVKENSALAGCQSERAGWEAVGFIVDRIKKNCAPIFFWFPVYLKLNDASFRWKVCHFDWKVIDICFLPKPLMENHYEKRLKSIVYCVL